MLDTLPVTTAGIMNPNIEEVFASDGPALAGPDEEEDLGGGSADDEETFASDKAPSDSFDAVLSELEVLMMEEELNEKIDAFYRDNCGVFEPGDENKLEYTTIFNEYTTMVETFIEERLGASVASFDMAAFCETLAQRAKSNPEFLEHPALEALLAYSDFDAFKEMMLSAKEGFSIEADSGMMLVAGEHLGLSGEGGFGGGMMMDDDGEGEEAPGLSLTGLSLSPTKQ